MRFALLLVISACGRLGFDAAGQPDVACEVDGTPCDDRNICSPTSTCIGEMCTPTGVIPDSCTVARSDPDFDLVQGANGWFYGFYNESIDSDGIYNPDTDFEQAALFESLWRPASWEASGPNFTWAYLAAWGGHPGSFPQTRATVRRWVSNVSGRATAVITMAKADSGGGDGVRAILVVDGIARFTRDIEGTDADGFVESVALDLVMGSRVDLLLHPVDSDSVDTTTQQITIHSR